jgi:cytochrome oxidase Cu insertion factor (SCO1/SenC/PrrC family)
MSKVKILIIMSVLLAVGCGQKERMKIASKPKDIKNTTISQGEPERPEYAIKAPDFSLRTVQGDLFNLSDYKGKVVLLNFWGYLVWTMSKRNTRFQ